MEEDAGCRLHRWACLGDADGRALFDQSARGTQQLPLSGII